MKQAGEAIAPVLPHNADAERAVIGTILLDAHAVVENLTSEDFYTPNHCVIFRHLQALKSQGKAPDLVLLVTSLTDTGELEKAGGTTSVAQCADLSFRVSNVQHYVDILKANTALRRWIHALQNGMNLALKANGSPQTVLEELARIRFPLGIEVETNRFQGFQTGEELAAVPEAIPWTVTGLVAKGAITELCGKVKVGKTTFVMDMVRAVLQGSPFLGYRTTRTPVIYLSEQPIASLRPAIERAGLLRKDFVALQHHQTKGKSWPEVAAGAVAECKRVGSCFLVVDTLAQFAGLVGDAENNAGDALEAMLPLQQATAEGIGVVVNRHERKSGGEVADSGRGSSAFAGAVDIVLSLRRSDGSNPKNRRLLQSLSRFAEAPNDVLIEWTGSEYVGLGERGETAIKEAKDAIFKSAPENEAEAVPVLELVKGLDLTRATAYRAVEALVCDGLLIRTGRGKRGDPHRFYSSQPQS